MVQFVSTRIPNFLLQSCFKWVTATRVAWLSKLLGMRAAFLTGRCPTDNPEWICF